MLTLFPNCHKRDLCSFLLRNVEHILCTNIYMSMISWYQQAVLSVRLRMHSVHVFCTATLRGHLFAKCYSHHCDIIDGMIMALWHGATDYQSCFF